MIEQLGESVRKLLLAGVGAVAATCEKGEEVLRDLVKKGELTVEQGKVLNEELKHNISEKIRENVQVTVVDNSDDLMDAVDGMDADQLSALKARIEKAEAARAVKAEEHPEEKKEEEAEEPKKEDMD